MNETSLQAFLDFLVSGLKAQPAPSSRQAYLAALEHLIALYQAFFDLGLGGK